MQRSFSQILRRHIASAVAFFLNPLFPSIRRTLALGPTMLYYYLVILLITRSMHIAFFRTRSRAPPGSPETIMGLPYNVRPPLPCCWSAGLLLDNPESLASNQVECRASMAARLDCFRCRRQRHYARPARRRACSGTSTDRTPEEQPRASPGLPRFR